MRKTAKISSLVFALTVACSAPAHADVLEIGEDGPSWITGGSAGLLDGASGAQDAVVPAVEIAPMALPKLAITVPVTSAGPAAWSGRIAQLAAKYDLSPALLEALVWQESRWRHDALSPVGARGLAQLMPGTARQLGVNPDDPSSNLEGGARYLREQLDTFGGNLEKALAAYNAGPGRVKQAGGIPAIRETQLYVAAIIGRLANPVRR